MAISRKKRRQRAIRQLQKEQKALKRYNKLEWKLRQYKYNEKLVCEYTGMLWPDNPEVGVGTTQYYREVLSMMKTDELKILATKYRNYMYQGGRLLEDFSVALQDVYLERLLNLDSVT